MKNRQRGTLHGLAIGDALGAAVGFQFSGTFPEVTGFRGGGPHGLSPGEWTDDTSMALALTDSIAHADWDLNDQARRYVDWWQKGKFSVTDNCFDIGMTLRMETRTGSTGDDRKCDYGIAGQRVTFHAARPVPCRLCESV